MIFEARQPREVQRRHFVRGIFIGLLLVFAVTSFFAVGRSPPVAPLGDPHANPQSVDFLATGALGGQNRKKVLAFVGVQTGFTRKYDDPKYVYELRREELRKTWFPNSQSALDKLEADTGVVLRFVIGHSESEEKEWNVKVEEERHGGFLRLDVQESYLQLADKTLVYLKTVVQLYDPDFIMKVDDDVYLRLDRVPYAVRQWKAKKSDYVGCMKRGPIFKEPGVRWHEPQHELIGDTYYTHSWGTTYAMSGRCAGLIAAIPNGSLRFLNNEDTSFGAWMLALNVTMFDDRRLCSAHCTDSSIAVYDIPKCAGLCDPQTELAQLHATHDCRGPAIPEGLPDIPMEREAIPVYGIKSRQSSLVS